MARGVRARRHLVVLISAIVICQAGVQPPAFVLAAASPPLAQTEAPAEAPRQRAPEIPRVDTELTAEPGVEQVALRTANSQTFLKDDGSYTTNFFSSPSFYQPQGSSSWAPIDTRFAALSGSGPNARADKAHARVSLNAVDALSGFMTLEGGGYTIRFLLPPGISPGRPGSRSEIKENGLFAEYSDFFPGAVGMRVFAHADGVKSFLVFNQRPTITSFSFAVDAPGLTLSKEADGSVVFKNGSGTVIGRVPRPFMMDSSNVQGLGSGTYSEAVTLSLFTNGPLPVVRITPDPAYLDDAVYPVYIDPTVSQFPDVSGTAYDTHATSHYPTTNFATSCRPDSPYYCENTMGHEPGTTYDAETFIKFGGVQSFLANVHVDVASLKIFPYWQYYHSDPRLTWVNRINTSWTSTTLNWNNRPLGVNDLNPYQFYSTEGQWATFDVKAHTQQVVNGTMSEDGYRLHGNGTGQGNWKRMISREENGATMGARKPYLSVSWHRPSATPSTPTANNWIPNRTVAWTYANGDATYGTAQTKYQVQVGTSSAFTTVVRDSGWLTGTATSWGFPSTGTTMTEGTSYWWRVRVQDGVGWSNWSTGAQFRYDTVAPTASITAPTQNATVSGTVTVTGTASDATGWDHYNLEYGAGSSPTTWSAIGINPHATSVTSGTLGSWNTSGLSGLYTIRLRVYDKARLTTGFSTVLRQVTVGNGPVASVSSPLASAYVRGSLTVTGTASAGTGFVNYVLSYGSSCAPSSWTTITTSTTQVTASTLGTWNTTSLGAGAYTLKLVTTAGTTATATLCVTVDNTPPTATITYPEANRPLSGTVAVTGSATDSAAFASYDLEVGVGTSPSSWTPVLMGATTSVSNGTLATWVSYPSQGVYTVRLTVRDAAGNSGTATKLVYVDNSRRGEESLFTRVPFDLGGGWRMGVGAANGELTVDRPLFSIPSYGPSQSLALHYSSQISDSAGMFGTGWRSDLTQYLAFESGFVLWHRADGGLVSFGQVAGVWTALAGHYEILTYDAGTSRYTITSKDQSKLVFAGSPPGRLVRMENRFGKALTFVWGGTSATATDASGRATTMTISGSLITAVTDSAGRTWSFGYTTGNLTTVTDPLSAVSNLGYGTGGLAAITRQRSRASGSPETIVWSISYTGTQVTGVFDPIDASVANTFAYAAGTTTAGLLKEYSPVTRDTWTYSYDHLGRVTSRLDPEGFATGYTFDGNSNVTQLVRPIEADLPAVDQSVTFTYDARGNLLTRSEQLNPTESVVTRLAYNATNDLLILAEGDNYPGLKRITRYTYDTAGHLTSTNMNCTSTGTTPPTDSITCTGAGTQDSTTNLITLRTYTANDCPDTETDPLGHVTKHVCDAFGNQTNETSNYSSSLPPSDDINVTTQFAYDQATVAGKAGYPTSTTDPVGTVTTVQYDSLGRPLVETLPSDGSMAAESRTTAYDELGNVLTETKSSEGTSRSLVHTYDKNNRELTLASASGKTRQSIFDAAGNEVSTTWAGVTTSRIYDGLGRVTAESAGDSPSTTEYDGQGRVRVTVDSAGVATLFARDLAGRELSESVSAPEGLLQTTYTHDALGNETGAAAPGAIVTTNAFDRAGRQVSTDTMGATTTFAYDRGGRKISTVDAGGSETTTAYDGLDRLSVVVANDVTVPSLPTEDVLTTTYHDAAGRVIATQGPDGVVSRVIFNSRGLETLSIANCVDVPPAPDPTSCTGTGIHDATTNVLTEMQYSGFGELIRTVSAEGTSAEAIVEYAWDTDGHQVAIKDPRGSITRLSYDSGGRITSLIINCTNDPTNPAPPATNWSSCAGSTLHDGTWNVTSSKTYDGDGNLATETEANGRVTRYVYDEAGRLVERVANYVIGTPAADQSISTYFAYDDAGRQSATRIPTANRSTFTVTRQYFDSAGRLVKEVRNCTDVGTLPPPDLEWQVCAGSGTLDSATNLVTEYGYDSRGSQSWIKAPDPSASSVESTATVTTDYAYNELGQLCRVLENAGTDLASLADPCATAVSGTATSNVSTRYIYDGIGNLVTMVDGRGNVTQYGYDASGNMTSLADANGKKTLWTFDGRGRRIAQSPRATNPTGTLISWAYDATGRMITRTADGQSTSYTFDAAGNRLTAASAEGTITTTYDRLGRPMTVSLSNDTSALTSYGYSLNSASWTDPSGTYLATVDAFGRPIALTDPVHGSSAFAWSYRADNQPATFNAPSSIGLATTYAYDAAAALSAKTTVRTPGNQSRSAYVWSRNRAGSILSEASTISSDPSNGTVSYGYDPLGRLVSYARAGVTTQYAWDTVPNRSSVQVGTGGAVTSTFDPTNRLTSSSDGSAYSHDSEGRLTARPGQTLIWDSLGRLSLVRNSGDNALIATYTYDALDRLRTVENTASRTRFRYRGLTTIVAQTVDDNTGATIRSIASDGLGERLFDWTGSSSNQRFYGTNQHRDVTWVGSSSAAVTGTIRYDPWGTVVASSGGPLPEFGFQSAWTDANSALSWLIARWYAPALGRFISEDAGLGDTTQPSTRNLYAYGSGDPVDRWDPDGRWWYRMRTDETTEDVALRFFGGRSNWGYVFNANRARFVNHLSFPSDTCIYIKDFRMEETTSTCLPKDPTKISGRRADSAHSGIWSLGLEAVYTLYGYDRRHWWRLRRDDLVAKTVSETMRKPSPTVTEWWTYHSNLYRTNTFMNKLRAGTLCPSWWPFICGIPLGGTNGTRYADTGMIPVHGTLFMPLGSGKITTVGSYMFIRDGANVEAWDKSHEYIHYLQYQGRSTYISSYFNEVRRLISLGVADFGGPANRNEAIAYLWGGWMASYLKYGEKEPWKRWLPMFYGPPRSNIF